MGEAPPLRHKEESFSFFNQSEKSSPIPVVSKCEFRQLFNCKAVVINNGSKV